MNQKKKDYIKSFLQGINFVEYLPPYYNLRERITYNSSTGNVYYTSSFGCDSRGRGWEGYKPKVIKKELKGALREHHIKYREIHGVDETIWLTESEHRKLHRRLRKEGKCNIPSKELNIIAMRASGRTEKYKKNRSEYLKKNIQKICFDDPLLPSIKLREEISYNIITGSVYVTSYFNKRRKGMID